MQLLRGIVRAYQAATHRATVQLPGSTAVFHNGVPVASHVPPWHLTPGAACAVVAFDESNPENTLLLGVMGPGSGERLFLGAGAMEAVGGTPALVGQATGRWAAWALDAASVETVAATVVLPPLWSRMDVLLYWSNPDPGSGDVVWQHLLTDVAGGESLNVTDVVGLTAVAAPAQHVLKVSTLATAVPASPHITTVRIQRAATHPLDTLPNDATVLGIELVRTA